MKVVVTKPPAASLVWYEHAVGQVFEVIYETQQEYYVRTGDSMNTGNFIQKSDAKVLLND
jgi:hypothetical protein